MSVCLGCFESREVLREAKCMNCGLPPPNISLFPHPDVPGVNALVFVCDECCLKQGIGFVKFDFKTRGKGLDVGTA